MALEAQEVAVRLRLLGGTAFQAEADRAAATIKGVGVAADEVNAGGAAGGGLSGFLGGASKNLDTLSGKLDKFSKKSLQVGRETAVLSAGAAALLYYSAKQYSGEQKAVTLLETQAYATHAQADALERAAKGWAKYGVSTKEGLDAVYKVHSVFGNVNKDLEVMKAGMMGSKIGHADLKEVTDVLTAETRLWGSNPMKEMSLIEKTASLGKMDLSQLIQGMGSTTLALAHGIGMNQEAALSAISGVSAVLPGSGPETFINLMKTPFIKATSLKGAALEAAKKLGLDQYTMAEDIRSGPMGVIKLLQQLKAGAAKVGPNESTADLSAMFGGARGLGTLETLLKALPQIEISAHKLSKTGPTELEKNFAKTMGITSSQFEVLKSSLTDLSGEVGKNVVPVLIPAFKDLTSIVKGAGDAFKALPCPAKDGLIAFIALTAVLAPVAFMVAGMAAGLRLLLWPVKLLTAESEALAGTEGFSGLENAAYRLRYGLGGAIGPMLGLTAAVGALYLLTIEHGKHPFNAWEEAWTELFGGYTAAEKERAAAARHERVAFLHSPKHLAAERHAHAILHRSHPWSRNTKDPKLRHELEALEKGARSAGGFAEQVAKKIELHLKTDVNLDGQKIGESKKVVAGIERKQREHQNRR